MEENCAFVYGLHRLVPDDKDHPCCENWLRMSICFRKLGGRWKVVHEHISVPFNPLNNQIWKIEDPDVRDMPDYGAALSGVGSEKQL